MRGSHAKNVKISITNSSERKHVKRSFLCYFAFVNQYLKIASLWILNSSLVTPRAMATNYLGANIRLDYEKRT